MNSQQNINVTILYSFQGFWTTSLLTSAVMLVHKIVSKNNMILVYGLNKGLTFGVSIVYFYLKSYSYSSMELLWGSHAHQEVDTFKTFLLLLLLFMCDNHKFWDPR